VNGAGSTVRQAGRVTVVTGAGQGLGRAIAQRVVEDGGDVVVADLNLANAESVAAELGGNTLALEVDVADAGSVKAMAAATIERFGQVDALVNNAGILSTIDRRPFEELTVEEWDQVMNVNVRGIFFCCREFSSALRASPAGRIVNLSSAEVWHVRPLYIHYTASKAAVIGLTRALAREFGPDGVTVNAVAPGSTETEIVRKTVNAEIIQKLVSQQSIHTRVKAADIAAAVTYLIAPENTSQTGQCTIVDGGLAFQ
jgi:3-oxoacyl-[acyl-carrier protein] reductase